MQISNGEGPKQQRRRISAFRLRDSFGDFIDVGFGDAPADAGNFEDKYEHEHEAGNDE